MNYYGVFGHVYKMKEHKGKVRLMLTSLNQHIFFFSSAVKAGMLVTLWIVIIKIMVSLEKTLIFYLKHVSITISCLPYFQTNVRFPLGTLTWKICPF